MNPLAFVNWQAVNRRFIRGMWIVAALLVAVILLEVAPRGTSPADGATTATPVPHVQSLSASPAGSLTARR